MKFKLPRFTRFLLFALVTYGLYVYLNEPVDEEVMGGKMLYLAVPFGTTFMYVVLHNISREKLKSEDAKDQQLANTLNVVNLAMVVVALLLVYRLTES